MAEVAGEGVAVRTVAAEVAAGVAAEAAVTSLAAVAAAEAEAAGHLQVVAAAVGAEEEGAAAEVGAGVPVVAEEGARNSAKCTYNTVPTSTSKQCFPLSQSVSCEWDILIGFWNGFDPRLLAIVGIFCASREMVSVDTDPAN